MSGYLRVCGCVKRVRGSWVMRGATRRIQYVAPVARAVAIYLKNVSKPPAFFFDIALRIVYHLTMLTKAKAVSLKTGYFPSRFGGLCTGAYRAAFRLQSM